MAQSIGGSGAGAFGAIIGAALPSIVGSFSHSGTNLKGSAALMALQNKYWKENTQWYNENGYKFLRTGLESAGYNPILALGASPLNGNMPSATADSSTSASIDMASSMQANIAKKQSNATISNIEANTAKTNEEAITQQNIRRNYDADTDLKMIQAIATDKKMPYEIRKLAAETEEIRARQYLHEVTAAWKPYDSKTNRISANANDFNAHNKGYSSTVTLPFGLGSVSHTGAPNLYTESRSDNSKFETKYEKINGKLVPVRRYVGK